MTDAELIAPEEAPVGPRDVVLRISLRGACFGVVVRAGRVVATAPIGRWMLGRTDRDVRDWVARGGGTVEAT